MGLEFLVYKFYLSLEIIWVLIGIYKWWVLSVSTFFYCKWVVFGKVDLFVFYGLFCGEEKLIKVFIFIF